MPPQQPQRSPQQKPRCPACQNEPMKGSKAGEPVCKICGSGLSSSPLGKAAMKAAGDQAAAKVQQAMSKRRQQEQEMRGQQQAIIRGGAGMRPGMGAPAMPQGQGQPQGQPQVDPRMLAELIARSRGGR